MTGKPAGTQARLPIADNIAGLAARLRRRRPSPWTSAERSRQRRSVLAGAVVAVVLAAVSGLFLDAASVPWAYRVPVDIAGFFEFVTRYGKAAWFLIPTGVFVLILLAADWRHVPRVMRFAWSELGALVGYFFFAVALGGILTDTIKWILGRSRPVLFLKDGILTLHPISFDYAHTSFPSGHATTVAAATVAIALIARKWAIPMGIFAAIVALSRVVVVAHYPSDVIGGLFVGAAYAYALAIGLASKGIAFRRDPLGRLRPKTAILRRAVAEPGGVPAMLMALALAVKAGFTPARRSD